MKERELLWRPFGRFNRDGNVYFICECACGAIEDVRATSLLKDSFGCKKCSSGMKKHGDSGTPIYGRWAAMKQRVSPSNKAGRHMYFDRGIKVCDEWVDDFSKFKAWAVDSGFSEDLTLDRIDNDKGYSPENCRWVSHYEQNRNQSTNIRVEHNGQNMILKDWCKYLGLKYDNVRMKIYSGQSALEALGLSDDLVLRDAR